MKIEATCDTCHRTFLLSQIGPDSDAPGRCPFCGARFARHYSGVLVDSVEAAERAAADFLATLTKLQSMETGFQIDEEAIVKELSKQVREHDQARAAG